MVVVFLLRRVAAGKSGGSVALRRSPLNNIMTQSETHMGRVRGSAKYGSHNPIDIPQSSSRGRNNDSSSRERSGYAMELIRLA